MVDREPELLGTGAPAVPNVAEPDEPAGGFGAVESFIAARQHRLLRSAFLITGDLELAQDLLQDALIKLALNWSKVHTDPEAYLRTVLYRDAVSWWRRRRREFSAAVVPEQVTIDSADESAVRVAFGQALARLTPKQRAVLVLRYFDDLSVEGTAEVLGVSLGTVKSQTHAALRRLRDVAPEVLHLAGLGEDSP